MPATPMDEYAKGVQECRGALYVRPQGGDKLRPYERIFTAKSIKTVMPVPDQVRDDESGIQERLNLPDSGF